MPACTSHGLRSDQFSSWRPCWLMFSEIPLESWLEVEFPALVLHLKLMRVKWDYSLKLPGSFFAWVFMCCSLVLSEMTLWSCLVVTFPELVLLSFMYYSQVLSDTILCSCLGVTFPALVLFPMSTCLHGTLATCHKSRWWSVCDHL